ncbi:MAG: hypothetical protein JRH18_06720 [Deltaproteobacteria bacterium]|nr:hypothetical protein [Deltaproteobacteria bacterium]MBW1961824.1 hypothetical protein [Deltaproteobacteria bacterium]MBW2151346.1 hypothetical protein [Deltaproteobacteria bacterium]
MNPSGKDSSRSSSRPSAEQRVERASEASKKLVGTKEKGNDSEPRKPKGPVGLDIGTSHIVAAQNKHNYVYSVKDLNAFFTVPNAKFAKNILSQKEIKYYENEHEFFIIGDSAQSFANMFNVNTRRPMEDGFLSPKEDVGLKVIEAIVSSLIPGPEKPGEILCFSVPGTPFEGTGSVVYHESVVKGFLEKLGYAPISINEGMATVLSELSEDDYTGIGISMGGGMCNVCLSYLSFPVITFSIQMAGDYIDSMVGKAVGEPASRIKAIKEEELDLSKEPADRVSTALHIFYDEIIFKLLETLRRVMISTDKIPKISTSIPIVLSGGTAMPRGCKEKFASKLKEINLPVGISEVRLAGDPLNTTAKGALIMAMTEAG